MSEKVYVNICDKRKCPGPVYAVKKGDTLYSIAQKYHCRVRTLLEMIESGVIRYGEEFLKSMEEGKWDSREG